MAQNLFGSTLQELQEKAFADSAKRRQQAGMMAAKSSNRPSLAAGLGQLGYALGNKLGGGVGVSDADREAALAGEGLTKEFNEKPITTRQQALEAADWAQANGNKKLALEMITVANSFPTEAPLERGRLYSFKTDKEGNPVYDGTNVIGTDETLHPKRDEGYFYSEKPPTKTGGQNITLNNRGDNVLMDITGKTYEAITTQANAATSKAASVDYVQGLLEGEDTNSLTGLKLAAGKVLSAFGVKLDGLENLEAADSVLAEVVASTLAAFPGAISEGERLFSIVRNLNIQNTPEGREEIAQFVSSMAKRLGKKQEMFETYMTGEGGPNMFRTTKDRGGFNAEWKKYVEANPLVPESMRKSGVKVGGGVGGLKETSDADLLNQLGVVK